MGKWQSDTNRVEMTRDEVLRAIGEQVLRLERPHPVRVGIDGVTGSGKTTLADELAQTLATQARQVIRASIDDFHNPPDVRYRLGRDSPEGYYLDCFDYPSFLSLLLGPLGPGGSRRYRAGAFGQPDGSEVTFEEQHAAEDAIVIVDGVFLFRPELNGCWDYHVWIEVDQRLAMERGIARDAGWMGSPAEARRRYEQRYVPGEWLYLNAVRPWEVANVVVANEDVGAPDARFRL